MLDVPDERRELDEAGATAASRCAPAPVSTPFDATASTVATSPRPQSAGTSSEGTVLNAASSPSLVGQEHIHRLTVTVFDLNPDCIGSVGEHIGDQRNGPRVIALIALALEEHVANRLARRVFLPVECRSHVRRDSGG
jgi:hypothetical protein